MYIKKRNKTELWGEGINLSWRHKKLNWVKARYFIPTNWNINDFRSQHGLAQKSDQSSRICSLSYCAGKRDSWVVILKNMGFSCQTSDDTVRDSKIYSTRVTFKSTPAREIAAEVPPGPPPIIIASLVFIIHDQFQLRRRFAEKTYDKPTPATTPNITKTKAPRRQLQRLVRSKVVRWIPYPNPTAARLDHEETEIA